MTGRKFGRPPERERKLWQGIHPPGTRSVVTLPQDSQAALDGVLEECDRDPGCHDTFPDIASEVETVFRRLRAGPVSVPVLHPESGEPGEVRLNAVVASEAVRHMLYRPGWAEMVPAVFHQAAMGDFSGLAEFALFSRFRMMDGPGTGLWISISCQEEVEFLNSSIIQRRARGTLFSDDRAWNLARACDLWPHDPVPSSFHEPVASDVPVLLLSGERNPATPSHRGSAAAAHLPNSLHLVIPSGGHSFEGLQGTECVDRLVIDFLEAGSAELLDTSCIAEIHRPPFRTEPLHLAPGSPGSERVRGLGGRYVGEDVPFEVSVEPDGERLVLTLPEGDTVLLVPVAGDDLRFRPLGLPGFSVRFSVRADGRVRVAIEQPGGPLLVLVRD